MNATSQSVSLALLAILCWASLATLGSFLIHLPPFYLLGATFFIGSVPAWLRPKKMFPSWRVTLWGVMGYFAYHFFLFYSFRYAPAVEANLINYLWPMILVLISPVFFPGTRLKFYHFLGAALAAAGCAVLVMDKGADLKLQNLKGYFLAFGAALSWPLYSVVKKRMGQVSVWSVGGFCLGASILCFITHALIEPRVVLQWHDAQWLIILGLGPFGVAFYAWDQAMARGDSRLIGALSYLTPVLSTLGLVIFGGQSLAFSTAVAMILIISGASSGLLDFLPSKDLVK